MIRIYIAIGFILIALGGSVFAYHGCKQKWEAEQQVKALKEIQKKTDEVIHAQEKARERVEKMDPSDLLHYWGGMHDDGADSGKTSPPGKAKSAKP